MSTGCVRLVVAKHRGRGGGVSLQFKSVTRPFEGIQQGRGHESYAFPCRPGRISFEYANEAKGKQPRPTFSIWDTDPDESVVQSMRNGFGCL